MITRVYSTTTLYSILQYYLGSSIDALIDKYAVLYKEILEKVFGPSHLHVYPR